MEDIEHKFELLRVDEWHLAYQARKGMVCLDKTTVQNRDMTKRIEVLKTEAVEAQNVIANLVAERDTIKNSLREQTKLTGKYIEQNIRLKDALSRFAKIDLTSPIGTETAWDILNARAVLGECEK